MPLQNVGMAVFIPSWAMVQLYESLDNVGIERIIY